MPSLDTAVIVLAGIALFAAFVNGAIGYGFSSLTVPLALLFFPNQPQAFRRIAPGMPHDPPLDKRPFGAP